MKLRMWPSSDARWRSFLSLALDSGLLRERASGTWNFVTQICSSAAKTLIGNSSVAPLFLDNDNDYGNNFPNAKLGATRTVDRPEDIAVAVELKFLLPFRIKDGPDPDPEDPRPVQMIDASTADDEKALQEYAYRLIADTIQGAGSKATTIHAISTGGYAESNFWESHWIVKRANSAEPGPDETKKRSGDAQYKWVPVEISSPKMAARDPRTHRHIQRVLKALTTRHRLAANYTCEVHVHLGRLDGEPFGLPGLKRLASLLWVAEPTLRTIRDPESPNYKNIYTWGSELRDFSRLARSLSEISEENHSYPQIEDPWVREALCVLPSPRGQNKDWKALQEIWHAGSYQDLGLLLSGSTKQYRRLGFNFSAFGLEDERAKRSPRTVEFRMMEGTVDTDLIINWVAICNRIAEVAVVPYDDRFVGALQNVLPLRVTEDQAADCKRGSTQTEVPLGQRLGREFRGLMQQLDIPRAVYMGFEEKVVREHHEGVVR